MRRLPSESSGRAEKSPSIRGIAVYAETTSLRLIEQSIESLSNEVSPVQITLDRLQFPQRACCESSLRELIGLRLTNPRVRDERAVDSHGLREFERRALKGEANTRGIPYEGQGLMSFYRKWIGRSRDFPKELSIVVTDRLPLTWSEEDLTYHARVAVFGSPCVVSLSGMIEAPARPREYYLARQTLTSVLPIAEIETRLDEQFAGRYLKRNDPRIHIVLRAYLLQCLFYAQTGNPFCDDPDCVLFNAHWQEELIHSQVESGGLCDRHLALLADLRRGVPVIYL